MFEKGFAVCSVDVPIMDITSILMSTNFVAVISRATIARYIRVGKRIFKRQGVFPLLVRLEKGAISASTLSTTHLNKSGFTFFSKGNVLLMFQAVEMFVKNDQNVTRRYENAFKREERALLSELRSLHTHQVGKSSRDWHYFLQTRISSRKQSSTYLCFCLSVLCVRSTKTHKKI